VATWLTNLDRFVFGRYTVEVAGAFPADESLRRLQSCVKPFDWPMFFPSEGLYGTVTNRQISFSRLGSINRLGSVFEFVGTLVPTPAGTNLVGDVRAKWYMRLFTFLPFVFLIPILLLAPVPYEGPPANFYGFIAVWFLVVYSILTIQMHRNAKAVANYIGLVVGDAFSASRASFQVR
jgi:hypothetical protein